jgi:hypothetical protein
MESPGKYEENETNRDLLQSTVQKLPILRRKKSQTQIKIKVKLRFATFVFVLFFSQNK